MSSLPVFVGLDYHQDSVQVCVLDQDGRQLSNRSVSNDAAAIARVARRHGRPLRVAVESCCGAADLAEELVTRHQLPVELAHPGYVSRMKRGPDKTDFGDAQLLADLTRVNYLPKVWLAPESIRQLRRLVRHRAQLVRRRKDVKLRIRGLLRENRLRCKEHNAWTRAWFGWLEEAAELGETDRFLVKDHIEELSQLTRRIAAVEAKIDEVTADDPVVEHLLSIPGVGRVTAVTLRAEVGRFERFTSGKQLAKFCGVTPRNASSGARQADAGLIKAGNPGLRTVLIELAHRLISRPYGGRWQRLAHRMLDNGKQKNVVIAAVANRWTRWLHQELRHGSGPASAPARQKGAAPAAPAVAST